MYISDSSVLYYDLHHLYYCFLPFFVKCLSKSLTNIFSHSFILSVVQLSFFFSLNLSWNYLFVPRRFQFLKSKGLCGSVCCPLSFSLTHTQATVFPLQLVHLHPNRPGPRANHPPINESEVPTSERKSFLIQATYLCFIIYYRYDLSWMNRPPMSGLGDCCVGPGDTVRSYWLPQSLVKVLFNVSWKVVRISLILCAYCRYNSV